MRKNYHLMLENLASEVFEMGSQVSLRFSRALEAMENRDVESADQIGGADDEIDELYTDLEKKCSDLFALQQPVASDLRLITSSFKIITDLERIGDLVVNLTDYTMQIEASLLDQQAIMELGRFAQAMIDDSLHAFQEKDEVKARELAARDDQMDRMCEQATTHLLQHLIEWESQGVSSEGAEQTGQQVLTELLTIRDLERVADHAVNIAARTAYMVTTERDLI